MDRRERLASARLYLITDSRPPAAPLKSFLGGVLNNGVDVVQLRDKSLDEDELLEAAGIFRAYTASAGALFILNDRPDLAAAADADGVHLGQDDGSAEDARAVVGDDAIVGRSTHDPDDAADAMADGHVDYLGVGPVYATPTKPGRAPTGVDYIRYAARAVTKPWFAIGGISRENAEAVLAHGATRLAVVRALTTAPAPELEARCLAYTIAHPPAAPSA